MRESLETDLLKTEWISYKCTVNEVYAQNLYAALCNNIFMKDKDEWTCSWRQSGQIVADLIQEDNRHNKDKWRSGDYLDWYCSGASEGSIPGYVSEGFVTSEISGDLLNLGWGHKPYEALD
jgi:hypothetical protein